MVETSSEIEEAQKLIGIATFPGLKAVLESYLLKLKASSEPLNETVAADELRKDDSVASSSSTTLPPALTPVAPVPKVARTPILSGLNFIPIEGYFSFRIRRCAHYFLGSYFWLVT